MKLFLTAIVFVGAAGIITAWFNVLHLDMETKTALVLCKGDVHEYERKLPYDKVVCENGTIHKIYRGE